MSFRQQSELLREIHSAVMVFLIHNILPDDGHLRPADATGKISLLPFETRATLFFHPSRRVSFQHLDCFCDPKDGAQVDQRVSVIEETRGRSPRYTLPSFERSSGIPVQ